MVLNKDGKGQVTINVSFPELADSVIFLFEALVVNYRSPKEVAMNDNGSPSHNRDQL